MKYSRIIATVNEDGKNVYIVEETAKVTDKGIVDKFANVTGGSIFGDNFDATMFNDCVSYYCTCFEIEKSKLHLSDLLAQIEEAESSAVYSVEKVNEMIESADSLRDCIELLEEKTNFIDVKSNIAKMLAFCIVGDKRFRFQTIGYDCMTETALESLLKEAYNLKDDSIMQRAKSETEKFLTEHIRISEDYFGKNIIVKMSMKGNGGKRVSFENLLNVSFSETLRYTARGIKGKGMSHDRIMKQIVLHYFYEVLEFAGKKTVKVNPMFLL